MIELKANIVGEVQGVGFRATTRSMAIQLGLKGVVRNRSDGSVEIIAQGEEAALKKLIEKLQSIFHADMNTQFGEPDQIYPDFSIVP